jgi:hypothetical protein
LLFHNVFMSVPFYFYLKVSYQNTQAFTLVLVLPEKPALSPSILLIQSILPRIPSYYFLSNIFIMTYLQIL